MRPRLEDLTLRKAPVKRTLAKTNIRNFDGNAMDRHAFSLANALMQSCGPAGSKDNRLYSRHFLLPFVIVVLLVALTGCAQPPTSRQMDQELMTTTTSPIPGATAKILPAPAGAQGNAPAANFCVTDAGYCPLAAAAASGQNCVCEAGSLMYGGKTNAAPKTYKTPFFGS